MSDMLQKLEDKVISLVSELEALRSKMKILVKETQELKYENQELRSQIENDKEKLKGIVSLLDSLETSITPSTHNFTREELLV